MCVRTLSGLQPGVLGVVGAPGRSGRTALNLNDHRLMQQQAVCYYTTYLDYGMAGLCGIDPYLGELCLSSSSSMHVSR